MGEVAFNAPYVSYEQVYDLNTPGTRTSIELHTRDNMSVTTTDNARMVTVRHMLADYDLHHSQPTDSEAAPAPEPNVPSLPPQAHDNDPADWERGWRRVPAYRPTVNQLDGSRNTYQNAIEQNFVRVMFGGTVDEICSACVYCLTNGKVYQ